eukprot:605547-Hanusia_phi.AAC.2
MEKLEEQVEAGLQEARRQFLPCWHSGNSQLSPDVFFRVVQLSQHVALMSERSLASFESMLPVFSLRSLLKCRAGCLLRLVSDLGGLRSEMDVNVGEVEGTLSLLFSDNLTLVDLLEKSESSLEIALTKLEDSYRKQEPEGPPPPWPLPFSYPLFCCDRFCNLLRC